MEPLSSDFISKPALADDTSKGAFEHQSRSLFSGMRRRHFGPMALVVAISILATMPASLVSSFASPSVITKATTSYAIHTRGSSDRYSSQLSASGGNKKNLSSSERERRDEDRRRKERQDDVVIGKTSAKRDATDYPIDPEATEREFLRRASQEERMVHEFTGQGMDRMKSLQLEEADQWFDKVFEVRPEAYLWQAGIVKFYLGNFEGAAEIFARSASQFEMKFGPMGMGPASEERIWRNAAELKFISLMNNKGQKQYFEEKLDGVCRIAQIIDVGENDESMMGPESRKVHRLARELFDASVNQNKPKEVVSRAMLLSFAGSNPGESNNIPTTSRDIKKRKLNACYFLALHYDVTGEVEESKKWIKTAFKLCSMNAGKSDDIMDTLPLLHMTARDWFDDDPYDEDEDELIGDEGVESEPKSQDSAKKRTSAPDAGKASGKSEHMSDAYSDPVLEASIMEDVSKMKFNDIRDALRIRGISATGSKETLKERLFISLMDDAGYQSGFAP
mmetsp:Transcript_17743/g.44264  ORF Transcript_17743/g.44264 Transcript_17743/m.44264 type:complete len:507 (-) Transcript_17743:84-1604(-)